MRAVKNPDLSPRDRTHASQRAALSFAKSRRNLVFFAVGVLVILFVFFVPGKRQEGEARRGEIDASAKAGQVFLFNDVLPLAGERKIIEGSAIAGAGVRPAYAYLPGKWDRPEGYAAYRLRVRGLDPEWRYALLVSFIDTSHRLLADGKVLISGGAPGRTRSPRTLKRRPTTVPSPRSGRAREAFLEGLYELGRFCGNIIQHHLPLLRARLGRVSEHPRL